MANRLPSTAKRPSKPTEHEISTVDTDRSTEHASSDRNPQTAALIVNFSIGDSSW